MKGECELIARIPQIFVLILAGIILSGCGASQSELDANSTQQMDIKYSTLTAQAPTATTKPTETPLPISTPTLVPTDTPEPTATPELMVGWNKFEATGMEIWLPDGFEGGDLQKDLDVIVSKLKAIGPEFEQVASVIEANPNAFVMWAFDIDFGSSGYLTNMNIIQEQVLSVVTLDMYLQALEQQIPSYLSITEQAPGQLDRYDSIRLVIDTDVSGVKGKELMYVIKDGNTVWAITFATSLDEFDQRLPAFEQSVLTFISQP